WAYAALGPRAAAAATPPMNARRSIAGLTSWRSLAKALAERSREGLDRQPGRAGHFPATARSGETEASCWSPGAAPGCGRGTAGHGRQLLGLVGVGHERRRPVAPRACRWTPGDVMIRPCPTFARGSPVGSP